MRSSKEKLLSLREIQLVELDILKKTVDWFEENNISYCLCGGTLLGAIRHNGFIPWDDDIDIYVPREDYDRLKVLARKGEHPSERIVISTPGDEGYPYSFIKIRHLDYIMLDDLHDDRIPLYIWIDVFPLDHFPDDEEQHRRCLKQLGMYNEVLSACTLRADYLRSKGYYSNPFKFLKLICARILFLLWGGCGKLSERIDDYARNMDARYKDSNHVANGAWPNGMKDCFPVECLYPQEKHVFEGLYLNIPVNYDRYLTHFYGDYMTPPPIDARQAHHIQVVRSCDK